MVQLTAGNQKQDHKMKQNITLGFQILAVAAALGLAVSASAQSTDATTTASAPTTTGFGQLGSAYSGVAYTYDHVESSSPSEWRGFALDYNRPLSAGLDFNLGYDWRQGQNYVLRLTQQNLDAGLTAFTALDWGKPYLQALAGWEWQEGYGPGADSFAYSVGTGVEFQVAQPFVLTPFVNFLRATKFDQNEVDYGVKTAYRLTREWDLAASVQRDAVRDANDRMGYSLGVDYHF